MALSFNAINFQMGYADFKQLNEGIHTRLYSRAFIIDDTERRLVFVSCDIGMMSQIIRIEVIAMWCSYSIVYNHSITNNVVLP